MKFMSVSRERIHSFPCHRSWATLKMQQCWHLTDTFSSRLSTGHFSAGKCMFNVSNRNSRTRCEICSKLMFKFMFDARHHSRVFFLLTLSIFHALSYYIYCQLWADNKCRLGSFSYITYFEWNFDKIWNDFPTTKIIANIKDGELWNLLNTHLL